MKKLLLLCLVLLGGVMQMSAWTGTVRGDFNSWSSTANPFTSLGNWEMYARLDGSIIHNGDIKFKPYIDGRGWKGPDSDYILPTDASSSYGTESNNDDYCFVIKKNQNATDIYVHVKTYDDNKNDWWEVKVLVVEDSYPYPITFSSSWGSVSAYSYYAGIPLNGAWPGETLSSTSGSCSATITAYPGSKVIFTNGLGGDDNKTGDLDLVYNGIYSKANGLSGISVTISDLGYATFSSAKAVDFSGVSNVDAYLASAITDSKVVLTKHNKVPDHNGVLLKGTAGTYNIPVTASPDAITTNYLMATVDATKVAGSDPTNNKYRYFLSGTTVENVGFYYLKDEQTSAAGKAYLETSTALATSGSYARVAWTFEDTTTGIANVDVNSKFDANAPMYNLAGQRVSKSYKGVVIVNGKKMLNK